RNGRLQELPQALTLTNAHHVRRALDVEPAVAGEVAHGTAYALGADLSDRIEGAGELEPVGGAQDDGSVLDRRVPEGRMPVLETEDERPQDPHVRDAPGPVLIVQEPLEEIAGEVRPAPSLITAERYRGAPQLRLDLGPRLGDLRLVAAALV